MAAPFNWHWTQWIMEWCRSTLSATTDPALHVKTISLVLRTESATDNTPSVLSLSTPPSSLLPLSLCRRVFSILFHLSFLFRVVRFVFSISFLLSFRSTFRASFAPFERNGDFRDEGVRTGTAFNFNFFFFFFVARGSEIEYASEF